MSAVSRAAVRGYGMAAKLAGRFARPDNKVSRPSGRIFRQTQESRAGAKVGDRRYRFYLAAKGWVR